MKHKLQILISCSAVSVLAFTAAAQNTATPKTDQSDYAVERQEQARYSVGLGKPAKASEILGRTVCDLRNVKLGKVTAIELDVESGRIVEVILASGGFLGFGEKMTAVPPEVLLCNDTNKILELDLSHAKFSAAPKFYPYKVNDAAQSKQVTEVYAYFGVQPYFMTDQEGFGTNLYSTSPHNTDGTINNPSGHAMDNARIQDIARDVDGTNSMISTNTQSGTWSHQWSNGSSGSESWSELGYVRNTRTLLGIRVNNLQSEKLGRVENFILDLSAGRIVAVIVASGGFLGMEDTLSAVPPAALSFNTEHDVLSLDVSREMLATSPHFKTSQWPDFSHRDYTTAMYRSYNVHPYFVTDPNGDLDNMKQNIWDRTGQTMSPSDQGNDPADLDTSALIRKDILADKNLSINAQNVKIATSSGQVTLRGEVNSAFEKERIGKIANRMVQSQNVDNQLEVTPVTTSNN